MMKRKYSDEIEKRIVEKYEQGISTVKIAEELNDKPSTIASIVKRHLGSLRSNKDNNRKYNYNKDYFKSIDTPDKAYWLGFIYADGFVQCKKDGGKMFGIALSVKDLPHLESFKKCIEAEHPIHVYKASSGFSSNDYCRIQIFGEDIYNSLVEQGVVPNKTLILKPPTLSEDLKSHFIRGYLDGDGCITMNKNQYAVKIVGTQEIIQYIIDYIEKQDIAKINHVYKRRPTDEVVSLELAGNYQVKKFLDQLYKDSTVRLDRKHERYKVLSNLLHSRAQ